MSPWWMLNCPFHRQQSTSWGRPLFLPVRYAPLSLGAVSPAPALGVVFHRHGVEEWRMAGMSDVVVILVLTTYFALSPPS